MSIIRFNNWALMIQCWGSSWAVRGKDAKLWRACSSEQMWEGCITSTTLKVFLLTVSIIRHLQLRFEVDLTTIRPAISYGFETLGRVARAGQTYSIVDSLCQNAEILLLCPFQLIGSGPVEGKGTQSHSDCQTDETEQTSLYPHVQGQFKAFVGHFVLKIIHITQLTLF